ncbi:MAG: hypothetical protein NC078_04990 [Ruminococcus sp.]|nr:hypothetical protein [Ruminococcus sp.]
METELFEAEAGEQFTEMSVYIPGEFADVFSNIDSGLNQINEQMLAEHEINVQIQQTQAAADAFLFASLGLMCGLLIMLFVKGK